MGFNPDPNHAAKGLKNFLINRRQLILSQEEVDEFNLVSNIVDFQAIEDLVEFTSNHEMNIAHHLSAAVLKKAADRYGKMDVGVCMKIFHKDTAAGISLMLESGAYPQSYTTTAHWIWQVANWLEIMSARGIGHAFCYKDMEKFNKNVAFLKRFAYLISKTIFTARQAKAVEKGQEPCLEVVQRSILVSKETILWVAEKILADPEVTYFPAGRGSGDPVESHHGHVRFYQPNPFPSQVKMFSKIISISQFLTRVMGSNVAPDDSVFLTEFRDIKKMRDRENAIEYEDLTHFIATKFDPDDFSNCTFDDYAQANALSYYIGYVMYKTILTQSKCDTCKKVYINDDPNTNDQYVNNLIVDKDWQNGSLTRPSKLANQIFHLVERMFKDNRDKYINQKNIKERLVGFMHQEILDQFDEAPRCHIRLIIARFMKGRLFFWANHMNKTDSELSVNKKNAYNESFASKTSRSKTIPELQ